MPGLLLAHGIRAGVHTSAALCNLSTAGGPTGAQHSLKHRLRRRKENHS